MQRLNGWKSCHMFSEHIGLPLVNQQGKHHFNDLWIRGCDSFGDWIPNAEDEFVHSKQ